MSGPLLNLFNSIAIAPIASGIFSGIATGLPAGGLDWAAGPGWASAVSVGVPAAVFAASLVGSAHCASMCGPIVLCLGTDRARVAAYNMGRLFAYAALGALAGALGNGALIALRERTWLSAASLAFMGLSLILIGARVWSKRPLHLPLPASLLRAQARAFRALQGRRLPRSLAVFLGGSLSIFLPCGHLYAFALGAAASGSAIKGILFMGFFWLGTVPALGLGAHGLRRLLKPGLAQGPRWAGALLVLAGLISVGAFATQLRGHGQATAPGAADGAPAAFVPRCH